MKIAALATGLPLLILAGCGPSATPDTGNAAAPAATPSAAEDYYAKRMDALSDKDRNAVLLRAIKDAGGECAAITGSETHAPVGGRPAWTVHCAAAKTQRALDWVVILEPGSVMRIVRPAAL